MELRLSKSRKLERAVEAFGDLPADVMALGKPLSVHPPSAVARIGSQWAARLRAGLPNTVTNRRILASSVLGLPLIGAIFFIPFLNGAPFGKAPPDLWLIFPVSGLLLGLSAGLWWWHLVRSETDDGPPPLPAQGSSP